MPTHLFADAINDAGEGFAAINYLKSLCKTSVTATAIRYATHSPDPVAVLVSSGATIDYCFMSDALRNLDGLKWLRKGERLPTNTETHAFNLNKEKVADGDTAEAWTSLDIWFDGAPAVDMKEDVVGLGSYGRTLTVLFTDEAIVDDADD